MERWRFWRSERGLTLSLAIGLAVVSTGAAWSFWREGRANGEGDPAAAILRPAFAEDWLVLARRGLARHDSGLFNGALRVVYLTQPSDAHSTATRLELALAGNDLLDPGFSTDLLVDVSTLLAVEESDPGGRKRLDEVAGALDPLGRQILDDLVGRARLNSRIR